MKIKDRIHKHPCITGRIRLSQTELDIFHETFSPNNYLEADEIYIEDRKTLVFGVVSEENYNIIVGKLETLFGGTHD